MSVQARAGSCAEAKRRKPLTRAPFPSEGYVFSVGARPVPGRSGSARGGGLGRFDDLLTIDVLRARSARAPHAKQIHRGERETHWSFICARRPLVDVSAAPPLPSDSPRCRAVAAGGRGPG